jgi:serine/threonine-protein kinase SRPK3
MADASASSSESSLLSRLASGGAEQLGRTKVATLLDEFFIVGPNSQHRCIVTDVTGCSIARSKEASMTWMFPVDVTRSIAAQTLQALAYTHSCGMVHGSRLSGFTFFS